MKLDRENSHAFSTALNLVQALLEFDGGDVEAFERHAKLLWAKSRLRAISPSVFSAGGVVLVLDLDTELRSYAVLRAGPVELEAVSRRQALGAPVTANEWQVRSHGGRVLFDAPDDAAHSDFGPEKLLSFCVTLDQAENLAVWLRSILDAACLPDRQVPK